MDGKKQPSFYKRLQTKVVKSSLNSEHFLPLDIIQDEITKANVEAQVPSKRGDLLKKNVHDRILQTASKVFAILVLIGESDSIRTLLADKLKDSDLPLSLRTPDDNDTALVSRDGRVFQSFRHLKEDRVTEFLAKQWLVLAPVFDTSGRHFTLDAQCAMPFIRSQGIGGGAYSYVHRCELHPAHQRGLESKHGKIELAVKEFKIRNDPDAFEKEKENLEQLQSLIHPHLIRHYATCAVDNVYYVVFPWADGGNLWQFWENQSSDNVSESWVFEQMLGMTEALAELHRRKCRHGDLKPDNILCFDSASQPVLVIGDVGISRFHKQDTHLRQKPTITSATTPSYQAPEVYGDPLKPRSKTYDIWSLGCIFLEFAIWYLFDFDAIIAFQSERVASDHYSYFYKPMDDGSVAIHPKVSEVIAFLLKNARCSPDTSFGKLVALISDGLIQLEVEQRTKADDVLIKLQEIVSTTKSHNLSAEDYIEPFVFRQRHKGHAKHSPKDSVMGTSSFPLSGA